MITPSDLNNIQPRATQVWNCNKIGSALRKVEQGHMHLRVLSRQTNVEGAKWRVITILVHVNCLYPS